MGGPASPKNPFSRSEPEPMDFKKPELRLEHIDSIAELSQIYLKADAEEFSEEDLVSNLPKLWQLSLSSKMKPHHAKKLMSIVSFVAGPQQDSRVTALNDKVSALGLRNEILRNELLSLKGRISALHASSEKHRRAARAANGESAAKYRLAFAILRSAHEENKRLGSRAGKLETDLQNYEKAIEAASELLGKTKKK